VQDSLGTQHEVQASLSGAGAPGAQTYSYRQLYAGMKRADLEARVRPDRSGEWPRCTVASADPTEQQCMGTVLLPPDSIAAQVNVIYTSQSADDAVAREITITRALPLDVDGVRLAHALSDAFEKQTSFLDRRDATYGHHQALVRIGTTNGSRPNFVELTVQARLGREQLAVRLSRTPNVRAHPPKRRT
jgi:hypothetical protein